MIVRRSYGFSAMALPPRTSVAVAGAGAVGGLASRRFCVPGQLPVCFRLPMRACLRVGRNVAQGQGRQHDPFVPVGYWITI